MTDIISLIETAITTVGFPVVAFFTLVWMNNKESDRHKEETETFAEALKENSSAIQELKNVIQNLGK